MSNLEHHAPSMPARRLPEAALPVAALAALILIDLLFVPHFGSIELKHGRLFGAPIDILHRATPVILTAIGMTLVIATRGIDLSVGAVMAITGSLAALMLTRTTLPVTAIVPVSLLVAVVAGLWNGTLVAWLRIQPIVATLILMVAGRGIAQAMGQRITFDNAAFEFVGSGSMLWLPFTVFISASVFAATLFLTRRTVLGTYIEAVGGNETAAVLSGINAGGVKLLVYAFSGLCAGIAGLVATADVRLADASNTGLYIELDAILAVVIGGTLFTGGRFSVIGSVVGALVIQTLTTGILMVGLEPKHTLVVKAITVVVVCFVQSSTFRDFLSRGRPLWRRAK